MSVILPGARTPFLDNNGNVSREWMQFLIALTATANQIFSGVGSPETRIIAPVGSLYLRADGGAGTTLYVKESGTGNVGWVGK